MAEEQKTYTRSEVEKNNMNEVLLILHDKVFNVSSFLNEHPGGEEVLLDRKGHDASEDFDDVGHSKDAMDLMRKYQVGVLVESERKNQPPKKGWIAGYSLKEQEKRGTGTYFYTLIGIFVLVLAIFFYVQ